MKLTPQRYPRVLFYGSIMLIPVLDRSGRDDLWHLPGREVASTAELTRRAEMHGVHLNRHDFYRGRSVVRNII